MTKKTASVIFCNNCGSSNFRSEGWTKPTRQKLRCTECGNVKVVNEVTFNTMEIDEIDLALIQKGALDGPNIVEPVKTKTPAKDKRFKSMTLQLLPGQHGIVKQAGKLFKELNGLQGRRWLSIFVEYMAAEYIATKAGIDVNNIDIDFTEEGLKKLKGPKLDNAVMLIFINDINSFFADEDEKRKFCTDNMPVGFVDEDDGLQKQMDNIEEEENDETV